MRRSIALTLMLIAGSGALATIPTLRQAALAQLRSFTAPQFGQGEATDPRFDDFSAGMLDAAGGPTFRMGRIRDAS